MPFAGLGIHVIVAIFFAVLFGFFLASTGMAPSINRFLNSIAETINSISF